MGVTVTPLSGALGAEVRGVDASAPLDSATIAEITDAWHEHIVLLFRDQNLTEDAQLRFAAQFGKVGERSRPAERRPEGADYNAAIMLISKIRENGVPIGSLPDGELWFHHDMSYVEAPHKGTFLYAIEVPSAGGHTRYANMYKAYDALPVETKRRIEGRKALQIYDFTMTEPLDPDCDIDKYTHRFQSVAISHPMTGRKALYVSPLMTTRIEGMTRAESDALLEELLSFTAREDFIYEHVWRPGDLVMWDDWCSTHARTDFPASERRLMRRCTILGQPLHE